MNPFFLDKSADFGALPRFRGDVQIYKANDLNLDMADIACTIIEVSSYRRISVIVTNRTQMFFDTCAQGAICLSYIL